MCSIRIPQLGSEGRRRWFGRWPKYNGKEFLTFRKVRFLPSVILTSTLLRKTLICARSSDYTARWLSEGPVSHSPAWGSLPCNCCNLCVGLQFLHESSFHSRIRKRGMHFFSRFSWLIEPYSTFFLINLSLYNVGPKPSILSGPNGGEPSKIR